VAHVNVGINLLYKNKNAVRINSLKADVTLVYTIELCYCISFYEKKKKKKRQAAVC
jgi:hypothetical protein